MVRLPLRLFHGPFFAWVLFMLLYYNGLYFASRCCLAVLFCLIVWLGNSTEWLVVFLFRLLAVSFVPAVIMPSVLLETSFPPRLRVVLFLFSCRRVGCWANRMRSGKEIWEKEGTRPRQGAGAKKKWLHNINFLSGPSVRAGVGNLSWLLMVVVELLFFHFLAGSGFCSRTRHDLFTLFLCAFASFFSFSCLRRNQ